ncbi:Methyl-CpG-binding domain-containing protein 9 [Linum grandiflorum]
MFCSFGNSGVGGLGSWPPSFAKLMGCNVCASLGNGSQEAYFKPNGGLIPTVIRGTEGLVIHDGRSTHLTDRCGATVAGSRNPFAGHNEFFKTDGKDLVANDLELRSISSKISVLKNTISCLESKLLMASPRKELLGKDYAGRLLWDFYRPDSTNNHQTGIGCSSSASLSSPSDAEENGHLKVGAKEPEPTWFSCQAKPEMDELIRWLRCFEPMDNDFIESLLRLQKFELAGPMNVGDIVQGTSQLTLTRQTSELAGKFCSLTTRALVSIERKYGPCSKTDGTIVSVDKLLDEDKKKKEVMYRCGCLELMVKATLALENAIKANYLRREWWFCLVEDRYNLRSSPQTIHTLDAAILYEQPPASVPPPPPPADNIESQNPDGSSSDRTIS